MYLLRCLIEQIDFKDSKNQKDQHRLQVLNQQLQLLHNHPNYASIITQALSGLELNNEFLSQFCKLSKLALGQEIVIALGLSLATDKATKQEGKSSQ